MKDSKYSPKSMEQRDLARVRNGNLSSERFAEIHGVMPDAFVRKQTRADQKLREKAVALMQSKNSPTHLTGSATQAGTRKLQ